MAAYSTRLDELMTLRDIPNAALAKLTGASTASISRYRSGDRAMAVEWARLAAPALNVDWPDILEPIGTPLRRDRHDPAALIAKRIEAVIYAYWGDITEDRLQASVDLACNKRDLAAICGGQAEPTLAFLIRLLDVTSISADWIFRGKLQPAAVPADIAARIGSRFPELLPQTKASAPKRRLSPALQNGAQTSDSVDY